MTEANPARLDLPGETALYDADVHRLRRYLTVNCVVLGVTILGLSGLELFLRALHLLFVIIALLLVELTVIIAWRLTVRRRPELGAQVLAVATWLSAIAITTVSPFILPASLLWVLLPLVLPLVVLPRRAARRVLLGTLTSSVVVVVIGTLIPQRLRADPPPDVQNGIVIGVVTSVSAVIAYSLGLGFERSTEQGEVLRESRRRIQSAGYDARRQIERDLHDGAQQRLVSTSVRLALVGRLIGTEPDRAQSTLTEAASDLRLALQDLRELAHGIYPPLLVQRGLGPALVMTTRTVPFPVYVQVPAERLPRDLEATLYFCCVEGVQNAVKHAAPTQQWVEVRVVDAEPDDEHDQPGRRVQFSIRDDGVGFDSHRVQPGVGLTNITDRIEAIGGTVNLEAAPGRGTMIIGWVPLR